MLGMKNEHHTPAIRAIDRISWLSPSMYGILAMEGNGYPKQFTEKAISRQLKRPAAEKLERVIDEPDQLKMEIAGFHTLMGSAKRYVRLSARRAYGAHSSCRTRCGACIRRKIPSHKRPRRMQSTLTCDAENIGDRDDTCYSDT